MAAAIQAFVQALADVAPIAQVLRYAPDQLEGTGAQCGNVFGGGFEKRLRGRTRFLGKNDQELAASAGSQEDFRQAQFGQQSTRQDFAQQADPMGSPGE